MNKNSMYLFLVLVALLAASLAWGQVPAEGTLLENSQPGTQEMPSDFIRWLRGEDVIVGAYSPIRAEDAMGWMQDNLFRLSGDFFARMIRTADEESTYWRGGRNFEKERLEIVLSHPIAGIDFSAKTVWDLEPDKPLQKELWLNAKLAPEFQIRLGQIFCPMSFVQPAPHSAVLIDYSAPVCLFPVYNLGGFFHGTIEGLSYYLGGLWNGIPPVSFEYSRSHGSHNSYDVFCRFEYKLWDISLAVQGSGGQDDAEHERRFRWRCGITADYSLNWCESKTWIGSLNFFGIYAAADVDDIFEHGSEVTLTQNFFSDRAQVVFSYQVIDSQDSKTQNLVLAGANLYPLKCLKVRLLGWDINPEIIRFSYNGVYSLRDSSWEHKFLLQFGCKW